MDIYRSSLFGAIPAPRRFEDLIGLVLSPPKNPNYFNVWMWRGQAKVDWPIHSSAYRRLLHDTASPEDATLTSYETGLLKHARHRGYDLLHGRQLSDFDLLARLQHHSAATRLLDTTRNALVGLYFACEKHGGLTGALFGFHSDSLGGYEGEPIDSAYDDVVATMMEHRYPQTWEPPDVSPRIAAQHSQFLYSPIARDKRGSICLPDKDDFLAMAITPAMKETCLTILSQTFDIRGPTLFPDIDGFGRFNGPRWGQFAHNRW